MSLFQTEGPAPKRRGTGVTLLILAILLALLGLGFLPTPYVIQRPGPAVNVLGESEGKPVISVAAVPTYKTSGALDLLTVSIVGNRDQTPNWLELALAWIDPAQAILPIDEVFPIGQTVKQAEAESTAMMEQSQQDAIYTALTKLGYKVPSHIYAAAVIKDSPAAGKLKASDYVLSVNGQVAYTQPELRALVAKYDGVHPLDIAISRAGKIMHFDISPKKDEEGRYLLGIQVGYKYDFPIKVDLQLSDIGGPSGGTIFALGIYDQMTPGELTGGENIAGTGTIDALGNVGPIGGIRQKLYAALRVVAKYFLAPKSNCNEVVGHVPGGIKVFAVENFDQALTAVTAIGKHQDLSTLPTCSATK